MPAAHPLPVLSDGDLVLRPSRPDDAPVILHHLQDPEVAAWWGLDHTLASVAVELERAFTIEVDGAIVGLLECHEEAEPMYPSVAFDIALAASVHGRHIGRRSLSLAIEHFISCGHHRFTIDPAVTNQMAIRCYQAAGFRPVGILRSYERAPDGTWRDALLMDLLSWELAEHPLPSRESAHRAWRGRAEPWLGHAMSRRRPPGRRCREGPPQTRRACVGAGHPNPKLNRSLTSWFSLSHMWLCRASGAPPPALRDGLSCSRRQRRSERRRDARSRHMPSGHLLSARGGWDRGSASPRTTARG